MKNNKCLQKQKPTIHLSERSIFHWQLDLRLYPNLDGVSPQIGIYKQALRHQKGVPTPANIRETVQPSATMWLWRSHSHGPTKLGRLCDLDKSL